MRTIVTAAERRHRRQRARIDLTGLARALPGDAVGTEAVVQDGAVTQVGATFGARNMAVLEAVRHSVDSGARVVVCVGGAVAAHA